MKHIYSLIFLLLSANNSIARSIVHFEISKPYAVLNFVEAAAGAEAYSSTLKSFIESKISRNDSAFNQLVKRFSEIRLHYTYVIDEHPASRKQHRSTYDLLIIAAVKSHNLDEFSNNSIGLLPNYDHAALFGLLSAAEKYYDRIVWKDYQQTLSDQEFQLKQFEMKANDLFAQFRHFYNSGWTDDIPFNVTLVPIPGNSGTSTATPHANSLCVGILSGNKDFPGTMGVVMHEICHVLYDEQRSGFQHYIDSAFKNSRSPYSNVAYSFFDEALATALGNGRAYQEISGHTDTSAWYNNKYIDGFARAISPLVATYLKSNKTMDKDFVDKAIDLFGKTFPEALTDYSILLSNMYLYADVESVEERRALRSSLDRYFQSSHYNFSSPVLHEYSLRSLNSAKQTQLIVIDRNHTETLHGLENVFPEIKRLLGNRHDPDYVLSFFDKEKRPVVIVYVRDKQKLDSAFKLMQQQQYLHADRPYQPVL